MIEPMLKNTALALIALCTAACHAHGFKIGELDIQHPYANATAQGQAVGGVFFKHIENKGATPDRLIAASVGANIAASTEIHTMSTENDVMRMRQITAIELPAKTTVPMTRGLKKDGYHVMLINLKSPLKEGEKIPVKLKFEQAGEVEVIVNVEALKASANAAPMHEKSHGQASKH